MVKFISNSINMATYKERKFASPLVAAWNTEFDCELLGRIPLIKLFDKIIDRTPLTKLGEECLRNFQSTLILKDSPKNVTFAPSLKTARMTISQNLNDGGGPYGYITGGLEGWHHTIFTDATEARGIRGCIVGLEQEEYIRKKGREPIFSFSEKASLWKNLAPEGSIIFPMPLRPESVSAGKYYDWIARVIGLWKNDRIIYMGSEDDPGYIKESHINRAASPQHILRLGIGVDVFHTSNLLVNTE